MSIDDGPSPAERARTALVCAAVPTVELAGRVAEDIGVHAVAADGAPVMSRVAEDIGVHAVAADGAPVMLVAAAGVLGGRAACGPAVATLHATRLLPLSVPDRVLARVTIHGTLGPVTDLPGALDLLGRSADPDQVALQLVPHHVRLDGEPVDPDAYRLAAPDPVAPRSDTLVTHLLRRHGDEMLALAGLLDRCLVDAAWTIAPAFVDRFGLTFHLAGPAGVAYPRLDFPAVVAHPSQLPAALRALHRRASIAGRHQPR